VIQAEIKAIICGAFLARILVNIGYQGKAWK
jgi:hypothetical protein